MPFENRVIAGVGQTINLLGEAFILFNGGLDVGTRTMDFVIDQAGAQISTTGVYGTGTINLEGGEVWHHKSGGVNFSAAVNLNSGTMVIDVGLGTQNFSSSSTVTVGELGHLNVFRNTTFNGGTLDVFGRDNFTLGIGMTLTVQSGARMKVGAVGAYTELLDLSQRQLTVTGAGSMLTHYGKGVLIADGSLSVLAGASVTRSYPPVGLSQPVFDVDGGGTLLVDGAGSTLTTTLGTTINTWGNSPGRATVTISNNAVVTLQSVEVVGSSAVSNDPAAGGSQT